MRQIGTIPALRQYIHNRARRPIVVVPTMGNLHAGHLALVERAKGMQPGCVIATIFVNPLQFSPGEDYNSYPRSLGADVHQLDAAGVDAVFTPRINELYPAGVKHGTRVTVPELENLYCGKFRPGHFAGVATVVAKLFNIISPDHAVFGEKDYQQLIIIRRLVDDLHLPVKIIGVPTVRESDGLAMSSRNHYLREDERLKAPLLYQTLAQMAAGIAGGDTDYQPLQRAAVEELSEHGFKTDYIEVCDAHTLGRPNGGDRVILAAAWLGRARLIDNIAV